MVDKDGNQRIKKVLLQIVEETRGILQKVSVWQERIGTSWGCVGFIKAFTLWLKSPVYTVSIVADSSPCTSKGAKEIGTGRTQTRAYQGLRQSTCTDSNIQFLKVSLAGKPFTANIDSQCHLILYASSFVASTSARIRRNALATVSVHLARKERKRLEWNDIDQGKMSHERLTCRY
jgi:hypothetical protein